MNKGDMHHQQAKREVAGLKREQAKTVKATVYPDKKSKPIQANTKSKPMEFVAVEHNDKSRGLGKFVPRTPASEKKAKAFLQKMNVPQNTSTYIGSK